MPDRGQPHASVVVAARNAAATISLLLEALEAQTLPHGQFETIVVDDGSTDATRTIVERARSARLISSGAHIGLPAARNLGIGEARAPVIALTDADCRPDPTWLESGVKRFAATDLDILAGGITIDIDAEPSLSALLDAGRYLDQEAYVRAGFAAGANLWVRRRVFERIGAFNEGLAAYGSDDLEFVRYATSHGVRVAYAPEVHLVHPARDRLRELILKSYRLGLGQGPQRRAQRGLHLGRGRAPHRRFALRARRPRFFARLAERGIDPSPKEVLLLLGGYMLLDATRLAGDLIGRWRMWRSPNPPANDPSMSDR